MKRGFSHNVFHGVLPGLISNTILDFSQLGIGFGEYSLSLVAA
jgi:hypothetical protein